MLLSGQLPDQVELPPLCPHTQTVNPAPADPARTPACIFGRRSPSLTWSHSSHRRHMSPFHLDPELAGAGSAGETEHQAAAPSLWPPPHTPRPADAALSAKPPANPGPPCPSSDTLQMVEQGGPGDNPLAAGVEMRPSKRK